MRASRTSAVAVRGDLDRLAPEVPTEARTLLGPGVASPQTLPPAPISGPGLCFCLSVFVLVLERRGSGRRARGLPFWPRSFRPASPFCVESEDDVSQQDNLCKRLVGLSSHRGPNPPVPVACTPRSLCQAVAPAAPSCGNTARDLVGPRTSGCSLPGWAPQVRLLKPGLCWSLS